ncbi:MAG TPA: class I SAM-dependent methyltransferase, partial [Pyrinomonadaceae bacterium]
MSEDKQLPVKQIFLGWSGRTGEQLAKAFRATLGKYPGLKYKMSGDLGIGKQWFDGINKFVDEADYCIGFVSPGIYRRIWFNFEAGYIYKRFGQYPIVLLGEREQLFHHKEHIPLEYLQPVPGKDKDEMIKLMTQIIGGEVDNDILEWSFVKWLKEYEALEKQLEWELKIESTLDPLLDSVPQLKYDDKLKNNDPLKVIITESINELGEEIIKIKKSYSFSAPAIQWSYNLVKLKENFGDKLHLKAVSIIDQQDTFWFQDIGREIMYNSQQETDERVFVFQSDADFRRYFDMIIEHSKRYKVRVVTLRALRSSFPSNAVDLGILYTEDSQLLALYDREGIQKKIQYSMSPNEIKKYEGIFEGIKKISKEILPDKPPVFKEIKEELFDELDLFPSKYVEMSVYTSVWEYLMHSAKHPYYKETADEMMRIFEDHRKDESEKCRILEFGAGTGNFTERFKDVQNADVLAFEIDWAYYNIAKHQLAKYNHIKLVHADARKVDPEGPNVKYKYIFSCFLEHHINIKDKVKYLKNVRNNLEEGGLFIVGDSFLRDFNDENKEERDAAIYDYHNHIIEIAKKNKTDDDFANMEENLLNAKLDEDNPEVGDHKVSLRKYEEYLREAGLKVVGIP